MDMEKLKIDDSKFKAGYDAGQAKIKRARNIHCSAPPCSPLGFRWSVAIDDQPPFACYADKVDSPNAIRYRTLDGETYGWRDPSHLRPLVDEADWKDLQAAIKSHKLEMARKFISENSPVLASEGRGS